MLGREISMIKQAIEKMKALKEDYQQKQQKILDEVEAKVAKTADESWVRELTVKLTRQMIRDTKLNKQKHN